jgi:hypothetical protein
VAAQGIKETHERRTNLRLRMKPMKNEEKWLLLRKRRHRLSQVLGALNFRPSQVDRIRTILVLWTLWNESKRTSSQQNDSCVEMHLALRSNALLWWRTLSQRGIDVNIWKDVRREFLKTYSPKITGQTAHAIGQLEQKASETVNDYFNRLDQIFDEMLISFPAVPTSQLTTYNDLRNHIQKQLFTGGLKETLRVEVLKAQSVTLMDSLNEASKVELILKKPANQRDQRRRT